MNIFEDHVVCLPWCLWNIRVWWRYLHRQGGHRPGYQIRLAECTCCACFPQSMMMMSQQLPHIRYVTPASFFLPGFVPRIHFSSMLFCCLLRTFRCIFDVILVTHQNIMTISGTHMQGLHSTQVRNHTQIDLLTCRVCFVKNMMITSQVRHHTHLDLSTCHVISLKHMMKMRQYFPRHWYNPYPLYARCLDLCLFSSALVHQHCDLFYPLVGDLIGSAIN